MNAPKIYTYHPINFEYLGSSFADSSPLEEGVWLFPAFSTLKKPPQFVGNQVAVFYPEEEKWQVIDDFRGEVWFDHNGEAIQIKTLGDPAQLGYTRQPPHEKIEKKYPVLTARQIRLLLRQLDKLSFVQDMINAMPSPQKEDAQIEWDYANVFDLQHFLVQQIIVALDIDWDSFTNKWEEFSKI